MRNLQTAHTKLAAKCISCECDIHYGDSVYKTSRGYFCPECIRESFTICRPEEDHVCTYYTETETVFCSIPAAKIRLNRKEDTN